MRCVTNKKLVFFQNGARTDASSSVLDGQGHVTAVHLASLRVSEIDVPAPRVRVSLKDIIRRNFVAFLVHSLFNLKHVHTGTANTAVLRTGDGIVAVEEASKPFRLLFDDEHTRIVGGHWLFNRRPIAAHGAPGMVNFTYSPFRPLPLQIDGVPVDVAFRSFPFMIHSAAQVRGDAETYVMPIMSARFGNFFKYLGGSLAMPVDETYTSEWLFVNRYSGTATFVDTGVITNPLHVVDARKVGDTVEIYSSNIKSFQDVLEPKHPSALRPVLELRKDVVDLTRMEIKSTRSFRDAAGDFPNPVTNRGVVLINRLYTDRDTQELVYFDTRRDEIVRRVHVDPDARDVLYYRGQLLFCTLDHFCVADARNGKTLVKVPIPHRSTNFHAALLEV
tara:strand:+ start:353 stop:1522 length:1170 start_codon:yes stop_codon:yes gene_type:complete